MNFFTQFHSFTWKWLSSCSICTGSRKSVEELTKTFQGLSSPSKEDRSSLPRRWASVKTAPFEIVLWPCSYQGELSLNISVTASVTADKITISIVPEIVSSETWGAGRGADKTHTRKTQTKMAANSLIFGGYAYHRAHALVTCTCTCRWSLVY